MKEKNKNTAHNREYLRAQLTAKLGDKQRQLSENSDRAAQYEKVISECREQLEEGRDRSHVRWLIPTLILAAGGAFLLTVQSRVLGWLCLVIACITFFRWLADFSHCLRKYGRIIKRMRHSMSECDKLSDKSSALRLETLELRQQLDQLEREQ